MRDSIDNTALVDDKTKFIFYDVYTDTDAVKENKPEIDFYLECHPHLYLGGNYECYHYTDEDNLHHYTNEYQFNYFWPKICEYLNIPYSRDDFYKIDNIIDGQNYMYYLPKKETYLTVEATTLLLKDEGYVSFTFSDYIKDVTFKEIVNVTKVFNEDELGFLNWRCSTPYHRSFKFSHQPVKITNKGIKNGRTIVISCDSHLVPLIPLFTYYFEKVIVMDNRMDGNRFSYLYRYLTYTDLLIQMSYNYPLNKYLITNLK